MTGRFSVRVVSKALGVLLAGGILSACTNGQPMTTRRIANGNLPIAQPVYPQGGYIGATSAVASRPQSAPNSQVSAVEYWRHQASLRPYDANVAISFIKALNQAGEAEEANVVAATAMTRHPENRDVALEYLRLLASSRAYVDALALLDRYRNDPNLDLRLVSFRASMLDGVGRHKEAQDDYKLVLTHWPNHMPTINNYALSLALDNQFKEGIDLLKQAARRPDADVKVRRNLSLLLALSGNIPEAVRVASQDMSSREARVQMNQIADSASALSPVGALKRILGLVDVSLPEKQQYDILHASPTAVIRGGPQTGILSEPGGWAYPSTGANTFNQIGGRSQ